MHCLYLIALHVVDLLLITFGNALQCDLSSMLQFTSSPRVMATMEPQPTSSLPSMNDPVVAKVQPKHWLEFPGVHQLVEQAGLGVIMDVLNVIGQTCWPG